jgi:hypothetical protein
MVADGLIEQTSQFLSDRDTPCLTGLAGRLVLL